MLQIPNDQQTGMDSPELETAPAHASISTTRLSFLQREIAAAAKAVEIANAQERQVGARRPHPGGREQRYFLSDEGRALILQFYDSQTETITWLAEQLSTPEQTIPRWQVRKWAKDLGIARIKEPFWSEAEIAYLRNSVRRYGLKRIARALGRSETSVKLKAKRLGIRKIVTGDGYTMRAVCSGLHVDHHQVERWIEHGWFWGERRESSRHGRQRGDIWYFTEEAIRELVRQHPEEIDLRRVDRDWFIKVLLGPPEAAETRPAPALPRRAARSAYAHLSDEAHSLLITHYTGNLHRTEALAEVLGVTSDEVTTWAVLLGLEDGSLHHPRVHQQERKARGRKSVDGISQSVRHLLAMRFTGDPGTTEALADDLGISVDEVYVLAKASGIQVEVLIEKKASQLAASGERPKGKNPVPDDLIPLDRLPLQAQLHIALHYHDTDTNLEQLAEEISGMLETTEATIGVDQLDGWASLLGLHSRRKPGRKRIAGKDVSGGRKQVRRVTLDALHLDPGEWSRFLSSSAAQRFHPTNGTVVLATVEEIRLGHQVHLGTVEQRKPLNEQDRTVIDTAMQAEKHLAEALLPLVWKQALLHLGRGVSLEALLTVGQCGLDEAIFRFDYADSHPLVNCALPAILCEMEQLIASTPAPYPDRRYVRTLHSYAQLADVSCRLTRGRSHAPTCESLAEVLTLTPAQVEKTIRAVIEATWTSNEGEEEERGRERVPDVQFVGAFMKTTSPVSRDIIKEMTGLLPLTPFTIQVRYYSLRLHTRIAERDRRQELDRLRVEAKRAEEPLPLRRGPFLWDVIIDGTIQQRWTFDAPYGTLAERLSTGSRVIFDGHAYETTRVYYSTLAIQRIENGSDSPEGRTHV